MLPRRWRALLSAGSVFALGLQTAVCAAHYTVIKSFGNQDLTPQNPYAALIEGSDGALYGTSYNGGTNGLGTVFRVNKDGSAQQVLHHFIKASLEGQQPRGSLLLASNGWLYGATSTGGGLDGGTLFKLKPDGSGYTNLHQFGTVTPDGSAPDAGLIQGTDGALYGTSSGGGTYQAGTVFRVSLDGSSYSLLYTFKSSGGDGRNPQAALLRASDGMLYGTTYTGGSNGVGVVYTLSQDGSLYNILHHFRSSGGDGRNPQAAVIEGTDGALYGTTFNGGSNNLGTVFRLSKDGSSYTILHHFAGLGVDGANPQAELIQGSDGSLYGTTSTGGSNNRGAVFKLSPDGSGYQLLCQFSSTSFDGRTPQAGLLSASDGSLYGTTYAGGTNNLGTLYRLKPDGSAYGTLVSFNASAGDATGPQAGVVFGTNGALFGTTRNGGLFNLGALYRLAPDGQNYAVLHSFAGNTNADGSSPRCSLTLGNDGLLYGTTYTGGASNGGTVFKVSQDGTQYAVVYSFGVTNGDAANPSAALLQAGDGYLYGTTYAGGATGNGTVFKCSKDFSTYTVLHSFSGADGAGPLSSVVQGSDGYLYGTTYYGGSHSLGTVFQLSTDGTVFQVLHHFAAGQVDGTYPAAELREGSDGFLYGTTTSGGTSGATGTIFKLDKQGNNYALVHSFVSTDGTTLQVGLVTGRDGAFYGATVQGGSSAAGTLFMLNSDGSGFTVLQNLSNTTGRGPAASLIVNGNGVFYGTAFQGGLGYGTVFELLPPQTPDMLSVAVNQGAAQASFEGMAGFQYSLWRSADLRAWTALGTNTMPLSGVYTNTDSAPPSPAAYYRAAWVP